MDGKQKLLNRSLFLGVPENLGFLGVGRVNQSEGERTLRDKVEPSDDQNRGRRACSQRSRHKLFGVLLREIPGDSRIPEDDYEGLLRRLGPQYWGSQLGSFLSPTWHGDSITICRKEPEG